MAGLATATMVPSMPTIITPRATASRVSAGLPRQRRTMPPGWRAMPPARRVSPSGPPLETAGALLIVMRPPFSYLS